MENIEKSNMIKYYNIVYYNYFFNFNIVDIL